MSKYGGMIKNDIRNKHEDFIEHKTFGEIHDRH